MTSTQTTTQVEITSERWMQSLPDDLKLNEISMPGTHDSCAFECTMLAECQRLPLVDQLNAGVRYIDVRCRQVNDRFELYHSSFSLGDYFDTGVIDPCVKFLAQNPSESILMLVSPEYKPENNTLAFDDLFLDYIRPTAADFWFLDDHAMPRLGQTRGKIVLLRRFVFLIIDRLMIFCRRNNSNRS